ncbi:MAG: VWA domain-containing protein [Mycobacterium sp.]
MTLEPVLPLLVLLGVAAAIVLARVVALRQLAPARTRGALWRWGGLTLAALLLVVCAARPVIGPGEQGVPRVADGEAPNVFLLVDRSPDMGVTDQPDAVSRMDRAREDVGALIDAYPGARVAVVSFAARPTLEWPLSADTWSLRPLASTFEPLSAVPVEQTNAGAAGNTLRYQLFAARQQYPRAKNLVYYLGAGAPGSQTPQREFNLPDGAVDGGAVLGYGPRGGPALRIVADEIGVPYVSRGDGDPLASALPVVTTGARADAPAPARSAQIELYWAPAILAAMLILVELYLVLREFRRTRLVGKAVNT